MSFSRLPEVIDRYRQRLSITRTELGRRAGVSPSLMTNMYKHGHWNMTIERLDAFARALKTTPGKLLVAARDPEQ